MIAIRFHGRGGQGAVVASKLLAAALFREGWQVQAFPSFGPERTGAPVAAFLRASEHRITIHSQIDEPDYVIVLDPVLPGTIDVTSGLRAGGMILVNSPRRATELRLPRRFTVITCDATAVALRHGLGTRTNPIVNTAMVGAFAAATDLVTLDSVLAVMPDVVPLKPEANAGAAREAFDMATRPAEVQ